MLIGVPQIRFGQSLELLVVAIGMKSFCSLILTQGKVTCMFSRNCAKLAV
jgi:hypothetical protein